ncbi:hypothetical protein J6590_014727 [Homalodisca vitripennis]|nr:hypothetical protein J6590_014727 [Homalodisca vitripennis]
MHVDCSARSRAVNKAPHRSEDRTDPFPTVHSLKNRLRLDLRFVFRKHVYLEVTLLLGLVGTVGTLELSRDPALVPCVLVQSGPVLVALTAAVARVQRGPLELEQ